MCYCLSISNEHELLFFSCNCSLCISCNRVPSWAPKSVDVDVKWKLICNMFGRGLLLIVFQVKVSKCVCCYRVWILLCFCVVRFVFRLFCVSCACFGALSVLMSCVSDKRIALYLQKFLHNNRILGQNIFVQMISDPKIFSYWP